jgi:hypothetical protein
MCYLFFFFLFVHSFQRYARPRSVAAKTRVCWPSAGDIVVLGQLKPISTGREHPRPSTKYADGMACIACAKATSRELWAEKHEGSLIGSARHTAQAFGGGYRFLRHHPSRRRLSAMHGSTSSSATVWQARRRSPQLCARPFRVLSLELRFSLFPQRPTPPVRVTRRGGGMCARRVAAAG